MPTSTNTFRQNSRGLDDSPGGSAAVIGGKMRRTTLVIYLLVIGVGSMFIPAASGQLIISEFRVRGPNGANDEFIELYNNSGADHTVAGGGTGYAVAASNGVARCVIPNGTVVPSRGHYLCVNSVGYSLANYPAGDNTTATGDSTYVTDIPDNAGIAIFNTSVAANFTLANRLDAVGSSSEANTLYKEGTGYPALTPFSIDYAFYRDECGKSGSITTLTPCPLGGPKDTNNNAADLIFVDTNGTSAGAGQRLGAPSPQNLSAAISGAGTTIPISPLDNCRAYSSSPNRIRDFTSDDANSSHYGTLDFRFRFTNNTGQNVTRLRMRIVDLTTFPAPTGFADLRPRTSPSTTVSIDGAPCGTGTGIQALDGTTLEQPPGQPNGGGFNSSMSDGIVTLGTPIVNGNYVNLRLLMGIQQIGTFKFGIRVEALPGGAAFYYVAGNTESSNVGRDTPVDFDGDGKTDISIFRPSTGEWWHRRSTTGSVVAATFGVSTDVTMPGDYTGDGIADRVVFRPSTAQWYLLRSENSTIAVVHFGVPTDLPAPGDFDGDGRSDVAVFRPSTGDWYIARSSDLGTTIAHWGSPGDQPVSADYDGDLKADLAIWRPASGQWWIAYSNGGTFATQFGASTDKAVPGRYTNDGKADIAFWRPSTGNWYVLRSEDFSFYAFGLGVSTDVPSPGDYDGDGKYDACVFRPSTSQWFTQTTAIPGVGIQTFGLSTDQSLPNSFVP